MWHRGLVLICEVSVTSISLALLERLVFCLLALGKCLGPAVMALVQLST